jgi:hypothetical protein
VVGVERTSALAVLREDRDGEVLVLGEYDGVALS